MGWVFHWYEAKKNQNGRLKKFKMAASKKPHFPALPILNISSWKFHGSVLGWLEKVDLKGIDMAVQRKLKNILKNKKCTFYCPTLAQKRVNNAFIVVLPVS